MAESVKDRILESLNTPPRRFQIRGVRFIEDNSGCVMLGDDMGLGKTYQTLAYMKLHPEVRPVVIVCPASLKYNWQKELMIHGNMESDIAEGRTPYPLSSKIWIVNYDILTEWRPWFAAQGPTLLVVDECQNISNRKAKRTIATTKLAKKCEQVIGLSGTPIASGPVEFFPILHLIAPLEFPSFTDYAFRYCAPKMGFRGHWDFRGASNLQELYERIRPFMLRRMKSEVLKDLPPKNKIIIPVKIKMGEYEKARDSFIQWLTETKGQEAAKQAKAAETLVRLGQLKKLAAIGKLDAFKDWMRDWRKANPGQALVVFAIHKAIIRDLVSDFPSALVVTGDTPLKVRDQYVTRFQNDPKCDLFIGNLKAAGVGLTLTKAATTAHLELSWVPGDHDQADDRVNRIGQTAKHINAFYFVAKNTIEEDIVELQDTKRDVIGQVLDGKAARTTQAAILDNLLKTRKAK